MSYHPSPTLQAYWDTFPLQIHLSKVRCPIHGHWLFMDEMPDVEQAWCDRCDRAWTTVDLVQWRQDHPKAPPQRVPPDLRRFYPTEVTCPDCGSRLALQIRDEKGRCAVCEELWSFGQLIDRAAQKVMAEAPNGAAIYRKPRH